MPLLRRCWAPGLVAMLACTEVNVVHEGEHVTLIADPALEPCGDTLGHMDRFVATMADYLGVSLADQRFTLILYSAERFAAEANCGWGGWCSSGWTIRSAVGLVDVELARFVMALVGSPPPFFAVGATVVFAPETDYGVAGGNGLPGGGDVQEQLALGLDDGTLAGAFTRFLIDRHGLDAYLAFYASVARKDSLPRIEAAHVASFGESLTETIVVFDAERRGCPASQFRLKLFECSAPPIAWDGDSVLLRRSLACGDEHVVGPFFDGTTRIFSTLEVATAGTFELSLAADEQAAALFGGCGGCGDETHAWLVAGREPIRLWLPAGRYYLDLAGEADAATTAALRIERLDEP